MAGVGGKEAPKSLQQLRPGTTLVSPKHPFLLLMCDMWTPNSGRLCQDQVCVCVWW